ncbi:MAG: hypothetical protein JXB04_04295 [Kiritimatiellae bacterium]|nr:hypothetical protein [Kiritimatiellia bacterium]
MAKRERGAALQLDSFLDIMTCLVGVLVLIIILTGVDASQIKVLIPTPMEHDSDKTPVYIECRDDELFLVPIDNLRDMTRAALAQVAGETKGDMVELLRRLNDLNVQNDIYRVDLSFALLGQFAIAPLPGTKGYPLVSIEQEKPSDWYGRILDGINKETQMITFLVRDDSYSVFKRARALAWAEKVEVSYELLDIDDLVKFGIGGSMSLPQ